MFNSDPFRRGTAFAHVLDTLYNTRHNRCFVKEHQSPVRLRFLSEKGRMELCACRVSLIDNRGQSPEGLNASDKKSVEEIHVRHAFLQDFPASIVDRRCSGVDAHGEIYHIAVSYSWFVLQTTRPTSTTPSTVATTTTATTTTTAATEPPAPVNSVNSPDRFGLNTGLGFNIPQHGTVGISQGGGFNPKVILAVCYFTTQMLST